MNKKLISRPAIVTIILLLMLLFGFSALYFMDINIAETVTSSADSSVYVSHTELPNVQLNHSATVMMAGDFLIHSSVYKTAQTGNKTYDFSPFFKHFDNIFVADLNIMNMEVPIDAKGNNNGLSTYPTFNCPLEGAQAVADMGIDLCITCNNHSYDQGWEGLLKSRENIRSLGMDTLGTYDSPADNNTPYIRDVNGIKVGIVAFTQYTNGLSVKEHNDYALNLLGSVDETLKKVQQLRDAGAEFIIVSMHWGIEYSDTPLNAHIDYAHKLCEGGVDVIMGSHPHVVQPIEKYTVTDQNGNKKDCLIVYSLGNFFANQGSFNTRTRRSMVVSFKIQRADDGSVHLTDSFYIPTVVYRAYDSDDQLYLRLLPVGEYLNGDPSGEVFVDESGTAHCREAWEEVQKIAGDDIPAVIGPSAFPDNYFTTLNNTH